MFSIVKSLFDLAFGQRKEKVVKTESIDPGFQEVVPVGNGEFQKIAEASVVEPPKKELTEIEKAIKSFNPNRDVLVISEAKCRSLNYGERTWVESLGNRVHMFKEDTLINVAVVTAH